MDEDEKDKSKILEEAGLYPKEVNLSYRLKKVALAQTINVQYRNEISLFRNKHRYF